MTNSKASSPTIDTVSIDIKLKPDPKGKKANEIRPKMKPILIKKRHEIGISSKEFRKQAVKRKKSKTLRLVYERPSDLKLQKRSWIVFRHLHRQQNLELDMNSCPSLALLYFAKYLKHLRSVKSLKVITGIKSGNENSQQGFKLFGRNLKHLQKIKNLEIDLYNLNIRDLEIFLLCQNFKYLKLMKSLRANLGSCGVITDKAIPHFAQYFKYMTLQNFALSVRSCSSIRDDGLKKLCDGFKGNRKLKEITFKFDDCYGLLDGWFSNLQNSARFIKSLQRINIKISKCRNIKFKQVDRLKSKLRYLSWKKKLKFRYKILTPGRYQICTPERKRKSPLVLVIVFAFAALGLLVGLVAGLGVGK